MVTPLVQPDGAVILVNRGFVPEDRRDPKTRAAGQIAGPVTVTGLLRLPEEASWFVPDNAPERNAWFRRDPEEIGRARGLTQVAPFSHRCGRDAKSRRLATGRRNPAELPQQALGICADLVWPRGDFGWRLYRLRLHPHAGAARTGAER